MKWNKHSHILAVASHELFHKSSQFHFEASIKQASNKPPLDKLDVCCKLRFHMLSCWRLAKCWIKTSKRSTAVSHNEPIFGYLHSCQGIIWHICAMDAFLAGCPLWYQWEPATSWIYFGTCNSARLQSFLTVIVSCSCTEIISIIMSATQKTTSSYLPSFWPCHGCLSKTLDCLCLGRLSNVSDCNCSAIVAQADYITIHNQSDYLNSCGTWSPGI